MGGKKAMENGDNIGRLSSNYYLYPDFRPPSSWPPEGGL